MNKEMKKGLQMLGEDTGQREIYQDWNESVRKPRTLGARDLLLKVFNTPLQR